MKIAVIGGGFVGLTASYKLAKNNHEIWIFEKEQNLGGLATGYREKGWEWSLEKHYHHWFTNDKSVLNLANEINYEVLIRSPKTSVYIDNNIYKLDSPRDVLTFPPLNILERLRMAAALGILRYNPFWKSLEKYKTSKILPKLMDKKAYQMIWEPLLINKFNKFSDNISLAWFWARIRKRTQALAYPKGGYLEFINKLASEIKKEKGKIILDAEAIEIKNKNKVSLMYKKYNTKYTIPDFDKIIVTLPSFKFIEISPQLPNAYKEKLGNLRGIGAVNLILRLRKQFFSDGTYWLNICDKNSPIMAIVEHTNFMDKKYYNNEHIVYLGNYLPYDHPHMKMSAKELLNIYDQFLRKINPSYQSAIIDCKLFTSPFAQPIIPVNYSKIMPPFNTPLKNVYLANIQQVYPWDRGTNYAIELGERIAKLITKP